MGELIGGGRIKSKQIEARQAAALLRDGMTVMVGGFIAVGTPENLLTAVIEEGVKNLTIICNDAGKPDAGVGRLIAAGCVTKIITSHLGANPDAGRLMNKGLLEVELVPQGTLIERIRAAGAGLGGVLTPTGLGTEAAEGKEIIEVDGRQFLLEKPLFADAALLRGSIADEAGNVFYKGSTRNFNPVMATAAKLVLCGAEEIVPTGAIIPENIVTPGIFIDYIIGGEPA